MVNIKIAVFTVIIFALGFMASEYRHRQLASLPVLLNTHTKSELSPANTHRALEGISADVINVTEVGRVDEFSWEPIHRLIANANYEPAISLLQTYLDKHPTSAQAFFLLASCYQKQAKPMPALEAWFRYVKLEADARKIDRALKEIKQYLLKLNETPSLFGEDFAWLIAQFDQLLSFTANDGELHLILASLYIKLNDAYQAQYHALMAVNDPSVQKRAENVLAALNGTAETATEKKSDELSVPLQHIGNQYLISVNIEGYSARLLLDTGASLSGLSQSFITRYPSLLKNTKPIRLNTASGTVNTYLFTVDQLTMGDVVFKQHILTLLPMDTAEAFDGLLGVDILGRFDFVIDQDGALLRLRARKK